MKSNLRSLLIPGCSFVLAIVLALASGAPMRAFGLRRAQAATPCVLSARIISMAATAKNWSFKITNLTINTSNTKQAVLSGKAGVSIKANVTGKDTTGTPFSFQNMTFVGNFTPLISKTYAAGGPRDDQFAPMTCSVQTLNMTAKKEATELLKNQGRTPKTFNQPVFPAQTVEIVVNGTFDCIDGVQSGIANGIFLTMILTANGAGAAQNP